MTKRPYLSSSVMAGLSALARRTNPIYSRDEASAVVWIGEMKAWRDSRAALQSDTHPAHDAPCSLQGPGGSATIPPEETSEETA